MRAGSPTEPLEFALRGFFLKLSVCEPLLRPLPPGLSATHAQDLMAKEGWALYGLH